MSKRNDIRSLAVPLCFLLLLTLILAIRSFFSFCQTDESFYAALANRLWIGERMLLDEWNSTQFYVPLLLPFYGGFVRIAGSTEGVLLFLRLLYLLFAVLTSLKLFFFILNSDGSRISAVTAASVILLYSRGNIHGVSYYNLCMLCTVSGFCSLGTALRTEGRKKAGLMAWSGMLFAAAVLSNPMLAPFAIVILFAAFMNVGSRKAGVGVFAGMSLLAGAYLLFLVPGTGLRGITDNLPHVLNSPEQSSILGNLVIAFRQIVSISRYVVFPAAALDVVDLLSISVRVKHRLTAPYVFIQSVFLAWTALRTISGICCVIVIPITVAAFPLLLREWRENRKTAPAMYLLGLIVALGYMMASNTGADAGTVGFCISAGAGLWICGNCLVKNREENRARTLAFLLLAVVTILPMLSQRVFRVYRDAPLTELAVRLDQGPAKGLFTTPEHAAQYDAVCAALQDLSSEYPEGKILYTKNLPWAYLSEKYGYGTSSPWRTYSEELESYYRISPNHRPDYVCVFEKHVGRWESSALDRSPGNETPNAMDYDGSFWETVKKAPIIKQTENLTVYDVRRLWK